MGRAYVAGPEEGTTFLSDVLPGEPCDCSSIGTQGLVCLACCHGEEEGRWSARQRLHDAGCCQPVRVVYDFFREFIFARKGGAITL